MIDLHCHLLPGIDDGPKDLESAINLCRRAVENGIKYAVTTPHITPGRYDNTLASITRAYQAFSQELQSAGVDLTLGMAAEVRLDPIILNMVKEGMVPFLGEYQGDKIMLLEFPHSNIPPGSEELVLWLLKAGIRPLIAHPERNKDIQNKLSKINPYLKAGCLLQITAGSLTGVFGDVARKRAVKLLENGSVTIIASDAHNLHSRLPEMEPGRKVAAGIVGEAESWALVRDRPAEIAAMHFKTRPL